MRQLGKGFKLGVVVEVYCGMGGVIPVSHEKGNEKRGVRFPNPRISVLNRIHNCFCYHIINEFIL